MTHDASNPRPSPPDIKKRPATDGTIDADYTWGRPLTTYLSPYQHLRVLVVKARLRRASAELR